MNNTSYETSSNVLIAKLRYKWRYFNTLILWGIGAYILVFAAAMAFVMDFPLTKLSVIAKTFQAKTMLDDKYAATLLGKKIDIEIDGKIETYNPKEFLNEFGKGKEVFLNEFGKYALLAAPFLFFGALFGHLFYKKSSEQMKSDEVLKGSEISKIKEFNSKNSKSKSGYFIFETED